jgi:hypothetical protein
MGGVIVRFQAIQTTNGDGFLYESPVSVCALDAQRCGVFGDDFITDRTGADGRAKVLVRLGHTVGPAVVSVTVPELNAADSAKFSVTPGAAVGVRALSPDTTLDIGATANLLGHVVDRYGNARTEVVTTTARSGTAFTSDAVTGLVTGREFGAQWLITRYNSWLDSTLVAVAPPGRLVMWSSDERVVRLVNVNGGDERALVSGVSSDLGAFPSFDATRHRVTFHAGFDSLGGRSTKIIVIDTTGSPRREIAAAESGFAWVITTRQLADGTLLVAGQRPTDPAHPDFCLWRIAPDNSVAFVIDLPGLADTYGGADISHTGAKVAYVMNIPDLPPELRVVSVSSGASSLLAVNGFSPRWSGADDRVAYLASVAEITALFVINGDGSGGRRIGSGAFSAGIGWSPDGNYLLGRAADDEHIHILRIADQVDVRLNFRSATRRHDYWQPDWR